MKTAIYARVSTKNKGQDAENQLLVLRNYCQQMGYCIHKEYIDYESGSSTNRPAFTQLYKDASKRQFQLLLFWSLDRFSRSGVRQTISWLQQLDDYGISFRSYSEMYLDSTGIFRDAILTLLATLSRQEQVRLSERVKIGLSKAKIKGRIGGRPRISDEKLQQIFELKKNDLSARQIALKTKVHHKTVLSYITQAKMT